MLFRSIPGDVNATTDQITVTAHGASSGDGPVQFTTDGTLPAPLVANTNYWLIAIDANTVQVATSKANADAGTAIDLTAAGSGTHTLRLNKIIASENHYRYGINVVAFSKRQLSFVV